MRDARWTKVRRDIWLHRSRSALVVAAIVVGIVGAGAVLDAWSLLRRATRDGYLATNPPGATLRMNVVDDALLARVRAMPSVQSATARRTVSASVRTPGGWRTAVLFAGSELATRDIGRIDSISGAGLPANDSLTIETSSLEFAELALGDTVALQVGDSTPVSLSVAGIARDAGLAPGWMEHVVYAFVTPATLRRLGAPGTFNELRIVVRGDPFDRAAIRAVALDVKKVAEAAGYAVAYVDVPVPGRHIHAGQMDSLLFTQGAFGLLALLLSAFLVVNLISAMLTGQLREIGMMKAVGASASQVAAIYLVLALVLGFIASLIALPAAAFIGWRYAEFSGSLLNFDVAPYHIPMWAFAVQLAVGMLLPVLAACVPVWRGSRIPVNDALRDIGESVPRTGIATSTPRTFGLPRPVLLSLRNAFRRRERMMLTLVTLSLGGAVYLGALGLRASVRRSVDVLYGDIMRFDIALRLADLHSADSVESTVARIAGVRRVEAWGGVRAAVQPADGMLAPSFPITALPSATKLVAFPLLRGAWLGASPRDAEDSVPALVVNQRLVATEPALQLGRVVALVVNGRPIPFRIVGVVESGPMPNAYMLRDALASVSGVAGVRSIVLSAESRTTAGQSELLSRLRETLDGSGFEIANAQLIQANRASVEDHLLMVAGFLLLMSQLALVVGGLGLASTMSLAVLERTREIGVLRAIGATHRTIFGLVQAEGLVIALASWLIAIPFSIPVSVLLGKTFSRIMMPLPVRYLPEPEGVALWFVVAVSVSLIATALPARRAMRVTTAAALAYE